MGMLVDRRLGATADWLRQRTGRSVVAQTRRASTRVGRIERTIAFDLNVPRGVWLQGPGADTYVPFDERGWLQLLSPNGTVDINKTPWGRKHAIGLDGCDCCPEDTTYNASVVGTDCIDISLAYDAETCSLNLVLTVDPDCLCEYCGPIDPG